MPANAHLTVRRAAPEIRLGTGIDLVVRSNAQAGPGEIKPGRIGPDPGKHCHYCGQKVETAQSPQGKVNNLLPGKLRNARRG